MWNEQIIDSRKCHILTAGASGPVFIWLYCPHEADESGHMSEVLTQELSDAAYTVIACEVKDWYAELSPWEGPSIDGSILEGRGSEFLHWLSAGLIPWLTDYGYPQTRYITGYSLAGLFALWSLYETDLFDGAVSGSGSFWFQGWTEYSREHSLKKKSIVYLSLGRKEEKSSNPVMASVGNKTRETEKILKTDPMAERVILEMNSGGHFADSIKRLVKGIRWTISAACH